MDVDHEDNDLGLHPKNRKAEPPSKVLYSNHLHNIC